VGSNSQLVSYEFIALTEPHDISIIGHKSVTQFCSDHNNVDDIKFTIIKIFKHDRSLNLNKKRIIWDN